VSTNPRPSAQRRTRGGTSGRNAAARIAADECAFSGYGLGMGKAEAAFRELPDGSLEGPDGIVYRRTPARVKRRSGSKLVDSGAPVVTCVYPEGLTWHDGTEAAAVWLEIKPRLVEGKPPLVRDLQWVGHLWESDAGAALLYFEGAH
jgi:hypothetical protein